MMLKLLAITCLFSATVSNSFAARAAEVMDGPSLEQLLTPTFYQDAADLMSLNQPTVAGVIGLFAGLGGNAAIHGVGPSMAPVANKALKQKYIPVAFENPIYYQSTLSSSQRMALIGQYLTLPHQLSWINQAAKTVVQNAKPGVPIVLAGRSTGSSLLLESLHRYIKNGDNADVYSKVSRILVMGPLDHRQEAFDIWKAKEVAYLTGSTVDQFALNAEPEIFKAMSYASEATPASGRKVPEVVFVIGTNDPLSTAETQIKLAREFQRLHPELSVKAVVTDTHHNPASSLRYQLAGKEIEVKTMKRLGPILLSHILSTPTEGASGFHLNVQEEAKPMLVEACFNSVAH